MKIKYLIIGGGISGLTLANYLKDNYLIIEKENEVGGYCRTIKKGNYIWDYAGHFFHFKTDEFKEKFLNVIPKEDIIYQDKCTKILYKNDLIDYPFQTNIHQLEKQEFIDCLYDLFNKEEKDKYDNFLDMLYGKFGKGIVEKFLKPYNEKLYAIDLTELDVDAMGRFFPYADKEAIIKNMKSNSNNSYNNSFLYPKNGAGSFIKVLSDNLAKDKILLNTSVKSIDLTNKKVVLSNDKVIEYDYLINTISLPNFIKLTNENLNLADSLSYNKVLVFNLGFNKKSNLVNEHWLYIPSKDCNYYRIGFYDNILNQDKLSMYVEIGYGKNDIIDNKEIEKQLCLTLDNLKKQNIIDDTFKLEEYVSIVMDPAYVHINSKTDKEVKEYFKDLENKNVYSIGRYGGWTYCSMEDCMLEAKKLVEKLK
ncbi:MAG: FAD-dependent oxidoreductase [Bacilli bacterium]|nr:FAD-dependent oxidoreductase [Bacilli bacterium]